MGVVLQFPSNLTMRRMTLAGTAVAVDKMPGARYVPAIDVWILGEGTQLACDLSLARVPYCELAKERWVVSIGIRHDDLLVMAAFDERFIDSHYSDCVYERNL